MVQSAPAQSKINTSPTQAAAARRPRRRVDQSTAARTKRDSARVSGETRGFSDRVVIEVGLGVVVYPPEVVGGVAGGVRRGRAAAVLPGGASEAVLAVKLGRIRERLAAGASNAERSGEDLIAHHRPRPRADPPEKRGRSAQA
jgi:hypothetical protein